MYYTPQRSHVAMTFIVEDHCGYTHCEHVCGSVKCVGLRTDTCVYMCGCCLHTSCLCKCVPFTDKLCQHKLL